MNSEAHSTVSMRTQMTRRRSLTPLGILASAEFLVDSTLDNFQSNLVDTVSSCGRTLLDTINHILDYSKINSFERNWRVARRPGTRFRKTDKRKLNDKEVPPMMNIYATVNVAAITEEVVEGVYTGQMYQDISSIEATDFPLTAQADVAKRGMSKERPKTLGKAKDVEVIIDIAHDNFVFTTQPGAFKRVSFEASRVRASLICLGCYEYLWECA